MLVTIARYRAITGDTATPSVTVSAKLELAEELLAEALGRPEGLEEGVHTETLYPTRDGYLWPTYLPLVDGGNYVIDGNGLIGSIGTDILIDTGMYSITYTGGWVERSANPTAANRLPSYIETDIAFAALALMTPPQSQYPAGATSVRLGDAAVTFGPDGPPRGGVSAVQWSRRTLAHRSSTGRGVPSSARYPTW